MPDPQLPDLDLLRVMLIDGMAARRSFVITPSDDEDLAAPTWGGIQNGGAEAVQVTWISAHDGTEQVFTIGPYGYLPIVAVRVKATGTTEAAALLAYSR
jgi:hypothetical protein